MVSATLYAGCMTTQPNITVNIFNYGSDSDANLLSQVREAVAPIAEAIPRIPLVFGNKMTNGDRGMLWAAYTDAFGSTSEPARHTFTRTVLGLSSEDNVTWSSYGSITQDQAYYMIRVLNTITEILRS